MGKARMSGITLEHWPRICVSVADASFVAEHDLRIAKDWKKHTQQECSGEEDKRRFFLLFSFLQKAETDSFAHAISLLKAPDFSCCKSVFVKNSLLRLVKVS
jgi:hypothetical protein